MFPTESTFGLCNSVWPVATVFHAEDLGYVFEAGAFRGRVSMTPTKRIKRKLSKLKDSVSFVFAVEVIRHIEITTLPKGLPGY